MHKLRILLLSASLFSFALARGQSTPPTSLEPGTQRHYLAPRHSKTAKFRKAKVTHTARYEFYKRVEEAAREKQRILKQLAKPQFSDHRYFGHKRIPKRRPAHKMRYCAECGLRH